MSDLRLTQMSHGGPDHRSGRYWITLDFSDEQAWRQARAALSAAGRLRAEVTGEVAFAQRWRDDAFEAGATIADRHGQSAVAEDIRALVRAPAETACNAIRLLWDVYHHAFHSMDDSEDAGENRIVMSTDADKLDKALDAFEQAFPMAAHGEGNADDLIAAVLALKEPSNAG